MEEGEGEVEEEEERGRGRKRRRGRPEGGVGVMCVDVGGVYQVIEGSEWTVGFAE